MTFTAKCLGDTRVACVCVCPGGGDEQEGNKEHLCSVVPHTFRGRAKEAQAVKLVALLNLVGYSFIVKNPQKIDIFSWGRDSQSTESRVWFYSLIDRAFLVYIQNIL